MSRGGGFMGVKGRSAIANDANRVEHPRGCYLGEKQ